MSIFYKINRFNKIDFHKPICLKTTIEGIENNKDDFNKITDSTTEEPETKDFKNDGNTLSVAFEGVKGRDSPKVARFFQEHPDEHYTPKEIAVYCGIEHGSAKMICLRFYEKGWIEQSLQNHYEYRQKITSSELRELEKFQDQTYHSIELTIGNTSGNKSGCTPSTATNQNSKKSKFHTGTDYFDVKIPQYKKNNLATDSESIKTEKDLDKNRGIKTVNVTVLTYPQKTIFHAACSENPLLFWDIFYIIGAIGEHGYDLSKADITNLEPNIDTPNVQIDGAQSIQLKDFMRMGVTQRIYNKKGKLRHEWILKGSHKLPIAHGVELLRGEQTLGTPVIIEQNKEIKEEMIKTRKEMENLRHSNKALMEEITNLKLRTGASKSKTADSTPIIRADKLEKCPVCNNSKSLIVQGTKLTCTRCGYINDLKN